MPETNRPTVRHCSPRRRSISRISERPGYDPKECSSRGVRHVGARGRVRLTGMRSLPKALRHRSGHRGRRGPPRAGGNASLLDRSIGQPISPDDGLLPIPAGDTATEPGDAQRLSRSAPATLRGRPADHLPASGVPGRGGTAPATQAEPRDGRPRPAAGSRADPAAQSLRRPPPGPDRHDDRRAGRGSGLGRTQIFQIPRKSTELGLSRWARGDLNPHEVALTGT